MEWTGVIKFGKFKGMRWEEVPLRYIRYLYTSGNAPLDVIRFIGKNIQDIDFKIESEPYTDMDIMPWGMFKGTSMGNVPEAYLIKLYNEKIRESDEQLYEYIYERCNDSYGIINPYEDD